MTHDSISFHILIVKATTFSGGFLPIWSIGMCGAIVRYSLIRHHLPSSFSSRLYTRYALNVPLCFRLRLRGARSFWLALPARTIKENVAWHTHRILFSLSWWQVSKPSFSKFHIFLPLSFYWEIDSWGKTMILFSASLWNVYFHWWVSGVTAQSTVAEQFKKSSLLE